MSRADEIFIANCRDILENGTWAPMAGKHMRAIVESMKNMEIVEPVISIKSALQPAQMEDVRTFVGELLK